MRTLFSWSRYLVLFGVLSLLVAALAVFVYGMISTATIIFEVFSHGEFGAKGARTLSSEMIEMIDLFLLGTILFITGAGLYELFVDPSLKKVLPKWMSVSSLDELKFNLLAVVIVMLAVLFLGVAASFELTEGAGILDFGIGIALVITAAGIAVFLFSKVAKMLEEYKGLQEDAEYEEQNAPDIEAT